MSTPLRVPYAEQLHDGYCLPACVEMVLAYLGFAMPQQRIAKLFGTSDAGTPFSRIQRLTTLGVQVEYATDGSVALLQGALSARVPPIIAAHGAWLPHAAVESPHALVLVGLTADTAIVLDPASDFMPKHLMIDAFLAAWIEMSCAYALLKR